MIFFPLFQDLVIYAGAKRKRTSERTDEGSEDPQENENEVTSSEEENDEEEGGKNNQADDEDDDDDDDRNEDEEEDDDHDEDDNQKRYDFRQRKAAVRYQAPREGQIFSVQTICIFYLTEVCILLAISTSAWTLHLLSRFSSYYSHNLSFDSFLMVDLLFPTEPKTKAIFFKTSRHLSPSRRRYRFSSTGPRSPYNIRRGNRSVG